MKPISSRTDSPAIRAGTRRILTVPALLVACSLPMFAQVPGQPGAVPAPVAPPVSGNPAGSPPVAVPPAAPVPAIPAPAVPPADPAPAPAAPLPPDSPGLPVPPAPAPAVPDNPPAVNPAPANPAPAPATPGAADAENLLNMQLSPGSINVGEQAVLTIRVENGRRLANYPASIEVDGLDIQFNGTNSQLYSINGRTVNSMELRYFVEGLEPGTYTIPGQSFTIDGKQYKTRPIDVVVAEGPPLDEALQPQAQLSVGKTEMWEGEEVPVTVSVLMHRAVQITSQPFPVVKSDGVAVARFDRHARIEQADINGQLWSAWRMPSSMVAIKSGDLTFGPAEVKMDVIAPAAGARRDPFGNYQSARRTVKVASNTVPIKVKPLPAEGKPSGFNGAVGNFQIVANTDTASSGGPQAVQLGDPIGFEIIVSGMGNFDSIPAPVLENPAGLRAYKPKMSGENRGLGIDPGQKTFSQILFTEKPGPVTVVFTLPYFDPTAGKYAQAKSQPIQFVVSGDVGSIAAAAASTAAETKDFSVVSETPPPRENLSDILPQALDGGRWISLNAAWMPVQPWVLHGIPAVLLALIFGTGTVRRLRAWALSRRPPPYAPRPCAEIARDLKRQGLSLLQFYGYVSEYAGAWTYWKKAGLPDEENLNGILSARDRWLYAADAATAAAPVPDDEQSRVASILTSRLSA